MRASVTLLSPRKIHSAIVPSSTKAPKSAKPAPAWIAPSTVRDPSVMTITIQNSAAKGEKLVA